MKQGNTINTCIEVLDLCDATYFKKDSKSMQLINQSIKKVADTIVDDLIEAKKNIVQIDAQTLEFRENYKL